MQTHSLESSLPSDRRQMSAAEARRLFAATQAMWSRVNDAEARWTPTLIELRFRMANPQVQDLVVDLSGSDRAFTLSALGWLLEPPQGIRGTRTRRWIVEPIDQPGTEVIWRRSPVAVPGFGSGWSD